jgi:hypothetical protein
MRRQTAPSKLILRAEPVGAQSFQVKCELPHKCRNSFDASFERALLRQKRFLRVMRRSLSMQVLFALALALFMCQAAISYSANAPTPLLKSTGRLVVCLQIQ